MEASLRIELDDLQRPQVIALLEEHVEEMRRISRPCSKHALDLDALRRPEVSFWTAWEGAALAGCAALLELDPAHGEIKSMRSSRSHLRRGVARELLNHILEVSRQRGYQRLSLETGAQPFFEPARRLYAAFGFNECGPFACYVEDPHSCFMTLEL